MHRSVDYGGRKFELASLILVACGLLAVCLTGCGGDGKDRPRNLIVISMDTVRADHLSCYGYERKTTPHIDGYAEQGAVFLNCTSPSSWTVPAHLSIFTGLEPATHGCIYYKDPGRLNANYETMAKIFTRNGFRTAAFTGGGYCGARHGMNIGFERFETRGRRFEHNMNGVVQWLDEVQDEPFFLFFHGFNAHRPYVPPPSYRALFAGDYQGNYDVPNFSPLVPQPNAEDLEYVISQYDGEIAYADHLMGFFFKKLEERGLLENSLIIITSDHGDEFYEHGSCDHIKTVYDELVRVPLIMFGPSVSPQKIRDHVGTIDILQTVLSIFGIEVAAPFQGADRSALLVAKPAQAGADSVENDNVYSFTGAVRRKRGIHLSSIRDSRWKLVTNLPCVPNPKCEKCQRQEQEGDLQLLFDLEADPTEQNSVADAHPEIVERMFSQLVERIKTSDKLSLGTDAAAPPSEEYLRTLRSLGYLGGEEEDGDEKE